MIKVVYIEHDDGVSLRGDVVYDVLEVATFIPGVPLYKLEDSMHDIAYYPWSSFKVVEGLEDAMEYGISNQNL